MRALWGFAPFPLGHSCVVGQMRGMGLAGEAQPSGPLGRDDADDVGVVAKASDAPFLDGD
jgi:hypothetical protein